MSSWLERLSLALLTAAGISGFAVGQKASPALLLLAVCAVGAFRDRLITSQRVGRILERLGFAVLAATTSLGWVFMAYPVLEPSLARFLSLACGGSLSVLCALFLLGRDVFPRATTLVPAALGTLAVGAFDPAARIAPFVVLAGLSSFAALAATGRGSIAPRAGGSAPRLTGRAAHRAGRLLLTLSIAAVLALAIDHSLPRAQDRVEAALAGLSTSAGAQSGVSFHARLGELEHLMLSREVVLRAWMPSAQKLRVRVFSRFDGQAWHPGAGAARELSPASMRPDDPLARELEQAPGTTFAIPPGASSPLAVARFVTSSLDAGQIAAPASPFFVRTSVDSMRVDDAGVLLPPALSRPQVYAVAIPAGRRVPREADPRALTDSLAVPEGLDPRLAVLARQLELGMPDARAKAHRTSAWVSSHCAYSLDPGKFRSRQPVAEFLFEKRRGYCEYFASATAVLLRLQGVPARYVTGFSVQEWNRMGEHYLVRAADAHAWIEAYVPGEGWLELDPTPAAESEALRRQFEPGWLEKALEGVRAEWSRMVALLSLGDAHALLLVLRESPGWLAVPLSPVVLLFGRALARRFREHRRAGRLSGAATGPASPELRAVLSRLDRSFARLGSERPASRGLLEHVQSLPESWSSELKDNCRQAASAYYEARFGEGSPDQARQAAERVEQRAPRPLR